MSIFTKIKKGFSMVFGHTSPWSTLNITNKNTYKVDSGFRSSIIMAPLLWFVRNVPQSKIIIKKDGAVDPEHDIVKLIKRPNPYYGRYNLIGATVLSLVYSGNAYWVKVRDNLYKPKELYYVPDWMITPVGDEAELITRYEYRVNGRKININPDDVVHFRYGIDPENPRKGLSPLKSLMREIFTDDESGNFAASLLVNQGIIGVVISPASDGVPINDVQGVRDYIDTQFTGANRGRPLVFSAPTKVEKLSFSPADLDLGRLRNISEERVTAVLGLPAAVVGFGTGVQQTKVGATMKELKEMAWENGVLPLQGVIAEDLETQLLPDFEEDTNKFVIEFDNSGVRALNEDESALYDRYNKGVINGWLTVSEVRKRLGWEVDKTQNVYLRPISLIETPAALDSNKRSNREIEIKSRKYVSNELHIAMYRSYLKMEKIFEKELKERFVKYGEDVSKVWLNVVEERGLKLDPADEIAINMVIDTVGEQIAKEEVLGYQPHYLRVASITVDTVNSVMKLGLNLTDRVEAAVMDMGGKRMGLVDLHEQTKDKMFAIIKKAREDGIGAYEVADMIKDGIPAGRWSSVEIRSKVIARTETKFAQNYSSIEIYKDSPDITSLQVVDGQLPTSDEECIMRDGLIVNFSEASDLMNIEHPNGTLSFLPVIGGNNAD